MIPLCSIDWYIRLSAISRFISTSRIASIASVTLPIASELMRSRSNASLLFRHPKCIDNHTLPSATLPRTT